MATQQQTKPQAAPLTSDREEIPGLLDQVIAATGTRKQKALSDGMLKEESIAKIEGLLPAQLKGQAARFVKRALLTFSRKPELEACTTASFIRAVLDAAELGLAIDGRLAHAVPFRRRVKKEGKEEYISEAQMIPDWKGLIAVARRVGVIKDCKADVVRENDEFEAERVDGKDHLRHKKNLRQPGPVYAAYAVFILPDGEPHMETMDVEDLNRIKSRTKSKDRNGNVFGAWLTDEPEMQRKTVVKRGMKYFQEDPAIARALEMSERELDYEEPAAPREASNGRRNLRAAADDAPPPEAPEPSPAEVQEQMAREDCLHNWSERLAAADTGRELDAIESEAGERREWLGPAAHQQVQRALAARRDELAGPEDQE